MLISSNVWDIAGAILTGIKTYWINRIQMQENSKEELKEKKHLKNLIFKLNQIMN
jgi:FMN phosphatase YigB (HAD superfamily)